MTKLARNIVLLSSLIFALQASSTLKDEFKKLSSNPDPADISKLVSQINYEANFNRDLVEIYLKEFSRDEIEAMFSALSGTKSVLSTSVLNQLVMAASKSNTDMPHAARFISANLSSLRTNFRFTGIELIIRNLGAFLLEKKINLPLDVLNETSPRRINTLAKFDEVVEQFLTRMKDPQNALVRGQLLQEFFNDYLKINSPDEAFSQKRLERMREFLPFIYQKEINQFQGTIYSDLGTKPVPSSESDRLPQKLGVHKSVICNQKGFDTDVKITCNQGNSIQLDESTPIGYNIYLPYSDVKAIVTIVYGGMQKKDRETKMFKPVDSDSFQQYLLSNGIAVVTLNLVDLLELDVSQRAMPFFLHHRLHQSINRFFEVVRDDPASLHADLDVLKGKSQFLYGVSFGGRTAVRHAELYPNTYAGYISNAGALSFEYATAHYSSFVNTASDLMAALNWLDPVRALHSIKQPLLIIHAFDDNSVNVMSSIDFYKKFRDAGLGHLARLILVPTGSEMSLGAPIAVKGHGIAKDPQIAKRVFDAIVRFIKVGPSTLSETNEFYAQSYELYAYRHMREATPVQKFLSEAVRRYDASARKSFHKISDKKWASVYEPIFKAMVLLDKLDKEKTTALLKTLHDGKYLTDEVVTNALRSHANMFAEYLKEIYGWSIELSVLARIIYESVPFAEQFKSWILDDNDEISDKAKSYLLQKILVANPALLREVFLETTGDIKQEELVAARKLLEEKLKERRQIVLKMMLESRPKVLEAIRDSFTTKIDQIRSDANSDYDLSRYIQLVELANPLLNRLVNVIFVRAQTRKLVDNLNACKNDNELCASNFGVANVVFAIFMRNEESLKSALREFEAMFHVWNWEEGEDIVEDVIRTVQLLMNALGERHPYRWLTDEEIENLRKIFHSP